MQVREVLQRQGQQGTQSHPGSAAGHKGCSAQGGVSESRGGAELHHGWGCRGTPAVLQDHECCMNWGEVWRDRNWCAAGVYRGMWAAPGGCRSSGCHWEGGTTQNTQTVQATPDMQESPDSMPRMR